MTKFKIGDRAYWFDIPGHKVFLEELELTSTTIVSESECRQRYWCYKNRREALEALSARLKELLDEEV